MTRFTGRNVFAAVAAFTVAVGVCAGGAANATPQPQKIRYVVSGSSPVAEYISFQTDTGQQQQANVTLPWTTQFTAFSTQVFVLSAEGPGSITCAILVDGDVVTNMTATGQPARTACSH